MMSERIYLTGYRGTGKTTVGKLISVDLGTECVDLDALIETRAGKTIGELFADSGEETFRDWETKCLELVATQASGRVISLGGGAILRAENREIIRRTGVCVWLTASPEIIAQRIHVDATNGLQRPALTDLSPAEEIRQLLARRQPLYQQTADLILATDDKSPRQVADEAIEWLQSHP